MQYYKPSGTTGDVFAFTTSELADADANCSTSSSMFVTGLLRRSKETTPEAGGVIATINGYTYSSVPQTLHAVPATILV